MTDPNFFILYVDNPLASAEFYAGLLGKQPLEAGPTFAMFALDSGVMLGLWSRHTVEPAALTGGGGSEVAISVADKETLQSMFSSWVKRSLVIVQQPVDMDFGHTFVALDPDDHRLRVFAATRD
jgi:hypothetical protein